MAKSSEEYWKHRKAREMYEQLITAEEAADEMSKLYAQASSEIEEEAARLVRRFRLKHKLTEKDAEKLLSKVKDPADIRKLIAELKKNPKNKELVAELESQAFGARLNRLQVVQKSVDTTATVILSRVGEKMSSQLEDIAKGAYYRELFGLQQRANAAFGFKAVDPDIISKILEKPWSGKNYSQRLWDNTQELAEEVKKQITLNLLTGKTPHKMTQAIEQKFLAGAAQSRRLIRTESNYVMNQLQLKAYIDAGIEKYIYVAILDLRTSQMCRELDKKRFLVKNAQPGLNYPPMHPWCRSTTIAWMPDALLRKLQQSAIDPKTGERIKVPADMTYEQWYKKYVEEENLEWKEKAEKNRNSDIKQFEEYRDILKDDVSDNLDDFQELKYTNDELYHGWSLDTRRRKRLINNPELRLPRAEEAVLPEAKFTEYFFNPDSKRGWPKGKAFNDRLGYNSETWELMKAEIAKQAVVTPAKPMELTEYGQKYNQEMVLYGLNERPMSVLVAWIDSAKDGKITLVSAMPGKAKI